MTSARARALSAVAVLAAAAGAGAWWLSRGGGGVGSAAGDRGDEVPASGPGATLAASGNAGRGGDAPDRTPFAPKEGEIVGVVVGPPGFDPRSATLEAEAEPPTRPGSPPPPRPRWPLLTTAVPDAGGRFRLARVRPGLETRIVVRSSDVRALGTVVLARAGGPPIRVVLPAAPGPATVTVLDADGGPVKGARVGLRARPPAMSAIGPPIEYLTHDDSGYTGPDGTVRLVPPPAGFDATVSVRAPVDRDDVPEQWSGPCVGGGTITVRLPRAAGVEGVVHDQHGQPAPDAYVAWRQGDGPWSDVKVQYDGTFLLTRLPPGPIAFAVLPQPPPPVAPEEQGDAEPWWHVRIPEGTPVKTVSAGARDVVLTVDMGATLDVRVEGWPRESGHVAILTREGEPSARAARVEADVSVEGRIRFRTLVRDAAYTLWVSPVDPPDDERIAYRTGVKPADGPLVVPLVPGKTMRVRLAWPEGRRWWANGVGVDERGLHVGAERDGEDWESPTSWTIHGLPEGEWTVRAEGGSQDPGEQTETIAKGTAKAAAGGEVEIKMAAVETKEKER